MKRTLSIVAALFALVGGATAYQVSKTTLPNLPTSEGSERLTLPSGWRVTPAGKSIPLPGDLPLKMIVSGDGKTAIVNTGGFHEHGVSLIDIDSATITQNINLFKNWAGLALDPEGDDLYIAGGGVPGDDFKNEATKRGVTKEQLGILESPLYRLSYKNGKLENPVGMKMDGIDVKNRFVGGIAAAKDGSLFVIDINADTVYRLTKSPRMISASSKVGYRPFAVVLSPDEKQIAVSNWGDKSVSLLDATTLKVTKTIAVGSHPNEMVWAKDGRLFVANANSDSVSVITDGRIVETIRTGLSPNDTIGATPIALSVTADAKRLFVANAGSNAVAVVDIATVGHANLLGFIPTGWYPSAVAVTPDGKKLLIGTGKGLKFSKNFPATTAFPQTTDDLRNKYDYIGDVLNGAVSIVDLPDAQKLAEYTKQVRANLPPDPTTIVSKAQIADVTKNVFPKIKHVIYIIRENRTYDQVFSDIKEGNGDPNLTMYGEKITPNAHALARKTVLLDNLYCSGEVSEDGHQWCNAAYATDFTEKAWTNSYSDRGEPNGDERLTESPGGYLWDNCAKHGKTYRSYGEFSNFRSTPSAPPVFSGAASLKDHASLAWSQAKNSGGRDWARVDVFIDELHAAEKSGKWSNFMVMGLGEDHTGGLRPGAISPFAAVASNDLGLGKIVEAVSKSKFWKETAIFVIEDDAQDGPDHVDAHRTVGLVISPYVKRGVVDSTLYTTASMVRTMEMILGLPPMTRNDELAMPMYNTFTSNADLTAYNRIEALTDLNARNPQPSDGKKVTQLDFSDYDRADATILNRQLWENAKPGVPMPAPVRSGLLIR